MIDHYRLGRTLGKGFTAKVKHATTEDGTEYALKIFRLENPEFNEAIFKNLKREVEATSALEHEHVAKYFEFKESAIMTKSDGT